MKEDYKKAFKKVNFIFFNSVLFNGKEYEKQMGPEISDQFLFRLQNKFRKITLLVIYQLVKFDDVKESGF